MSFSPSIQEQNLFLHRNQHRTSDRKSSLRPRFAAHNNAGTRICKRYSPTPPRKPRLCPKTRSGFERPFFRLATSGCIDDRTNIACFAVFARQKNACSRADERVFGQGLTSTQPFAISFRLKRSFGIRMDVKRKGFGKVPSREVDRHARQGGQNPNKPLAEGQASCLLARRPGQTGK